VATTESYETFSSWSPTAALVAGVKTGSGSRDPSASPATSGSPQMPPCAVVGQSGAGQVAARHALHRHHVEPAAEHRPAAQLLLVRVQDGRHLAHARRDQVAGHQVGQLLEPPHRQPGEHRALVRDGGRQHHVVRRQPVAGDQQQVLVVDGVELAHLAAGDQRQRQVGHVRSVT
jgi:hypothetical protein